MINAVRLIAIGISLIVALPAAWAQDKYPTKVVRLIVPVSPGGGTDFFARLLAQEFSERTGQKFFVENRPGASTSIGTAAAAQAKPDGYSLLVAPSSLTSLPAIMKNLPYDTVRDLIPITKAVSAPNMIAVHPSVPVNSVKELIALAKASAAKGNPMFYASGGAGTNGHLATALFCSMAEIRMNHVPYKSGPLARIGVISNEVPVVTDAASSILPLVQTGKLRALGVSSLRPSALAPGIPTIAEAVPGYTSEQWYGLFAPAGTPPEIIAWLHKETTTILQKASVKEQIGKFGLEVAANSPSEFAASVKEEVQQWGKLMKDVEITQ
jgi:tripartite-type tricarboxylate transporter receptor subunit TctC